MPAVEFTRPLPLFAALVLALLALPRYPAGGYYSSARRRLLTALRLAALVALLPAAGGLVWSAPSGPTEVIVLADGSASISVSGAALRDAFVADLRRLATESALTVLTFAGAPQTAGEGGSGGPPADLSQTNLAAAIETAKGFATSGRRTALVLLSDGEENEGSALATVPGLRQAGIPVLAYDLSSPAEAPPAILRAFAPRRVLPGEPFEITVAVSSAAPGSTRVRLLPEGGEPESREAQPDGAGAREVTFAQRAPRAGRQRYRLRLEDAEGRTAPAGERVLEVVVADPVAVTVLSDAPYEARALTGLLEQAGVRVAVQEPRVWRNLPDPAGDPGVILLDNLPASAIGGEGLEKLERLVRTRGAGLLALGGRLSLGAGEWAGTPLERMLPTALDPPTRGADTDLSLVIVLDASLSMFFRSRGEEIFAGSGPRKMELAKAAILQIAESLQPRDKIGLLESKDELRWVHPLGPVGDRAAFESRVAGIKAYGGGINFYSSIREAAAGLRPDPGAIRHIMVLADANDIDQLEVENIGRSEELVLELARERMTLSIFALGSPSDKDIAYLRTMALLGRGDFYLVADLLSLPRYFRSEYRKRTGEQFREEEFIPLVRGLSPVLRGLNLDRLPAVGGMNLVSIKTGAEELLAAPYGAPLLARWRYGRGRSAVFTTDSGASWARSWYSWPEAERFWAQLLHELSPRPAPPAVELRGERRGERVELTLRRLDGRILPSAPGQVRFEGPGGASVALLQRRGLHRFEAALPAGGTESPALRVGGDLLAGAGEAHGLLDLPPPAEFAAPGRGRPLLEALTHGTGGALVSGPDEVATRLAPPPDRTVPLFWFLLAALSCLFAELIIRY